MVGYDYVKLWLTLSSGPDIKLVSGSFAGGQSAGGFTVAQPGDSGERGRLLVQWLLKDGSAGGRRELLGSFDLAQSGAPASGTASLTGEIVGRRAIGASEPSATLECTIAGLGIALASAHRRRHSTQWTPV